MTHLAARLGILFGLWVLCTNAVAVAQQPNHDALPKPSVTLEAEEVVRIVINALADNDTPFPDAGIATTFNFASPGNKVNTGPLERFTRMVNSEPYALMVGHATSEFSDVVTTNGQVYQMVRITGTEGRSLVYAFRMGLQPDGPFKDMWMTEAVWPVATPEGDQQAF